jgi:hypothetical protein
MKTFNIGDKVIYRNEINIYLGRMVFSDKTEYHCVIKEGNINGNFAVDDELILCETATYFPVPKYAVGQVVYFIDNVALQVIILKLPTPQIPRYQVFCYADNEIFVCMESELQEDYK